MKYNPDLKKIWDDFVESSKNGTFLFHRDYMDYHADRFIDNSLLIYRKAKLYCLLPANRKEDILYSHQGLTYGGLVMCDKCSAEGILVVFDTILEYLKTQEIKKFIYKPVPHIYHTIPSEEDLYALFRENAFLSVRNISSTVDLSSRLKFYKDRREAVRRAERNGIVVKDSMNFSDFWNILNYNLKNKYGVAPVHSLEEIEKLAASFPRNIKLWGAFRDEVMMAGILCYITKKVIHAQYISASPEGKKKGAVDAIVDFIFENETAGKKYLDFGSSNEDGGRYLNESLIYQKEGFGGRGICYDTYEINIE